MESSAEHYQLQTVEAHMARQEYLEAIRIGEAVKNKDANLHGTLASCYFYVGELEKSRAHALLSGDRAPYKLSAIFRAKKKYSEARRILEIAPPLSERVASQHYFNLGAAYADDPNADNDTAIEYYGKALGFASGDLRVRIQIRMARAQIDNGHINDAKHILEDLHATGKTKVHLLLVRAQLLKALKRETIESALVLAKHLGLTPDIRRLESL